MTDTKRMPVPPMTAKSRNSSHIFNEFPFTEKPKSGILTEKTTNTHNKENNMSTATKIKKLYADNKDTIKRKAIVYTGAVIGLMLAGGAVEYMRRRPTVVVISDTYVEEYESDDYTGEPETVSLDVN